MSNFVFYGDWLDNIGELPVDVQDKIIADIVRYGVDKELIYSEEPTVSMAVNFTKKAIDSAKAKYQAKVDFGKEVGKGKKIDNKQIYELARMGISKSSVDHSNGWKQRKGDFVF